MPNCDGESANDIASRRQRNIACRPAVEVNCQRGLASQPCEHKPFSLHPHPPPPSQNTHLPRSCRRCTSLWFRVSFRVQCLGFTAEGLGFRVTCSRVKVPSTLTSLVPWGSEMRTSKSSSVTYMRFRNGCAAAHVSTREPQPRVTIAAPS